MSNNNKAKNLQPDTKAEGDNSINTKKGFLISLPSKKKNDDASSGIVQAKTLNDQPVGNNNNNNNGGKGGNQKKHGNNNRHGNAPKGGEKNQNTKENQKDLHKNEHNNNVKKNQKDFGKNTQGKEQRQQQAQKSDENKQKQPQKQQNKPQKNNHNNDRRGDNHQNGKNDRRDRHNGKERKNVAELPGLSPLSKEMRAFKSFAKTDAAEIIGNAPPKELSLEEKYKDAIPLADQIAAEEAKRKFNPKAMHTSKIDRSATANAVIHSAEAAGTPEEEQPHITDREYEIVGIRFREAGKIYYFDPNGQDIPYGTPVIVETARGAEYGYTAISNRLVPHTSVVPPLKKIKRIATAADTEKYQANKALEADAAVTFKQKVAALGLEMNLVFVEYTFDNSKLLFYFTAETRIDFRELVKELASVFRTRIELRQIGVRDEAKMLGGLGVCGRSVCCSSFLGDFAQVSIKMAKDQGLSLNSAKISGACGKLMCCLRYEDKVYEEEIARTPKVGSVVETSEGKGVVTEAQALKGIVKVTLENAPDAPPKAFDREDVKVVGFNKAAIKEDAEELKELKALEDNN